MNRRPSATYRIQFTPSFRFNHARRIVPYLDQLGIDCLYASPIFKAKAGSTHGYDVVDHTQLNGELGSRPDAEDLAADLHDHSMQWLQDFIPNHMAYDYQNEMLMDALENGPASRFYRFFDIEWDHAYESLRGRLLAPVLGKPYWEALESGDIKLAYDGQRLVVDYFDNRLPLRLETYADVLSLRIDDFRREMGENNPDFIKVLGVLYVLGSLSAESPPDERAAEARFIKRVIAEMYQATPNFRGYLDRTIEVFNGTPGSPATFCHLESLLAGQLFRLSFWKVATEEINYRRFFSINSLISLRMEEDEVFENTHSLLLELIKDGIVNGLRIDHIDGLHDPAGYLRRLRGAAPDSWIIVEKILATSESLPQWPVEGTTGYDAAAAINALYVNAAKQAHFADLYRRFTSLYAPLHSLIARKKRLILANHMKGDVDNLAIHLKEISNRDRYGNDITLYGIKRALMEILACFPVYRTYIDRAGLNDHDRAAFDAAIECARRNRPELVYEFHFIQRFLLRENLENATDEEREQWTQFAMRLQQYTGPLMAKGFEDTVFYDYNPLISLNEVGGDPARFGISIEAFHAFNAQRARQWPQTMNAGSTHDTKRGEDVRARINVLSEIPAEWEALVEQWNRINQHAKTIVGDHQAPDRNDEYFIYQTLLGTWPFEKQAPAYAERIADYMTKAVNEAKVHTTWLSPDCEYQDAVKSFVHALLDPGETNAFLPSFLTFQRKIAHFGIINSLSQLAVRLTMPGVPDIYQGTEMWDLSLVDPDNRREVDFDRRMQALAEISRREQTDPQHLAAELLAAPADGRAKLFVVYRLLNARRRNAGLFLAGDYLPLNVSGSHSRNIIAFARRRGNDWCVTIAPRFCTELVSENEMPLGPEIWEDTAVELPAGAPGAWHCLLSGGEIDSAGALEAASIMQAFPVEVLLAPA